jgi:hypothetical protein
MHRSLSVALWIAAGLALLYVTVADAIFVLMGRSTTVAAREQCARQDRLLVARDIAERTGIATTCFKAMKSFYVIGPDVRVAFKGRPGSFGFEAAPLRQALAALLPSPPVQAPAAP